MEGITYVQDIVFITPLHTPFPASPVSTSGSHCYTPFSGRQPATKQRRRQGDRRTKPIGHCYCGHPQCLLPTDCAPERDYNSLWTRWHQSPPYFAYRKPLMLPCSRRWRRLKLSSNFYSCRFSSRSIHHPITDTKRIPFLHTN